jgi:hypothetical protein
MRVLTEVRAAGAKGLGLFARLQIPRGTRIVSEKPLLSLHPDQDASHLFSNARNLKNEEIEQILRLSYFPGSGISRAGRWANTLAWTLGDLLKRRYGWKWGLMGENLNILNVFRSNSFELDVEEHERALFPQIARINHSCTPNAQANWHPTMGKFNVHAIRDIEPNEELNISYLHETGALRDARVEKLSDGYGFTCNCPACDLSTEKARIWEANRKTTQKSLTWFYSGQEQVLEQAKADGEYDHVLRLRNEDELSLTHSFITTLTDQGIAGREIASLIFSAAKMQFRDGQDDLALEDLEDGLRIERDCLGEDHPDFLKSKARVEQMKKGHYLDESTDSEGENRV